MKYKDVYKDYAIWKAGHSFEEKEIELLNKLPANQLYEVGIDFGNRIIKLKDMGHEICGGCEFNPMFSAYSHKHTDLYNRGMVIDTLDINNIVIPRKYNTIFTYKLLDRSDVSIKEIIEKQCDRYIGYEECLGGFYDSFDRP